MFDKASLGLVVLFARIYTVMKMELDDWAMTFAAASVGHCSWSFYLNAADPYPTRLDQILAVITSVVVTMHVHCGVGKHAAYISPPDLVQAVPWSWLSVPLSTVSACWGTSRFLSSFNP